MKGKMKAIIKATGAPGAKLVEVDIPQIGPEDILVKVKATSICGTDFHIYNWDEWSKARIKPPQIMGHEFGGEVVEVGANVKSVKLGDCVSAETHVVCGVCEHCREGNGHICSNTKILGVDRDGAFAEYVAIPASNALVNDKDVPFEDQSIQEPLGNAVYTVLSGDVVAKTVIVYGCGAIGQMAIAVAKAAGAAAVYAVDISPYRIELAKKMGATKAYNSMEVDILSEIMKETAGMGVDVVCEMSGAPVCIKQALDVIKKGGRMSILGIPTKEVELDINKIVFKGITINGITGRLMYKTWHQIKGLFRSGQLNIKPVITHTFPLEDFEKGMELMKKGECGKVVLIP